jgi:hypothetical protein
MPGIMITDILDNLADPGNIMWQLPFVDLLPKKVAKDPPEILMPGIREKTP